MKKELTRLQKRILVVKDALAQIKSGFLRPNKGIVCSLPSPPLGFYTNSAKKLLEALNNNKKSCRVCARGSLLLATISRFNKFSVGTLKTVGGTYYSNSPTDRKLLTLFDQEQIVMMERAFEGECNTDYMDDKKAGKCIAFYRKYKTEKGRLIGILNNILKNKGEFKP